MGTWAQLTQGQRDEVADLIMAVREWSGMMARLANLGRAISAKYVGNVETTLSGLDAGEIPISNPEQGQEALSKADLLSIVGYAIDSSQTTDGASGSYNTNYHRGLYVRAAGIYHTMQQGRIL